MIYIRRLFNLIIGVPLLTIAFVFEMIDILLFPIKTIISYIICGDGMKYDTWFDWIVLPIMKLLQKIDLIDKDIEFE